MKTFENRCTVRRARVILALSVGLLIVSALASLCVGASSVGVREAVSVLLGGEATEKAKRIVLYVRLPRLLAALLAGASLSLAGVLLQEVLRNPLAAPSVIGVNAGAGLFALCAMAFFPEAVRLVPVSAFLGAMCAASLAYLTARLSGLSKSSIVLAGVAISSLLGACMDAIVTLVPDAAGSRSAFSIGGFASVTGNQLLFALPLCMAGFLMAMLFRRELTVLTLGDEVARSLGVRVERYRLLFLAAAALLAGGAVSFAGLLGFIGLITPHVTRALTRGQASFLLPVSMILGALLCVLCDLAARTLFAPYEIPVGVVLSFVGAPFFLYLLIHGRGKQHDAA